MFCLVGDRGKLALIFLAKMLDRKKTNEGPHLDLFPPMKISCARPCHWYYLTLNYNSPLGHKQIPVHPYFKIHATAPCTTFGTMRHLRGNAESGPIVQFCFQVLPVGENTGHGRPVQSSAWPGTAWLTHSPADQTTQSRGNFGPAPQRCLPRTGAYNTEPDRQ